MACGGADRPLNWVAGDMRILALIDETPLAGAVITAARALGSLLALPVAAVHVRESEGGARRALSAAGDVPVDMLDGEPLDRLLEAVEAADVRVGVLGARHDATDPRPAGHAATKLLSDTSKPLLVVGPACRIPPAGRFGRVLVPLDGTAESTAAVAAAMELFGREGLEIVAFHVFDRDTVPAFFDQPQHGYPEFISAFLARHCAQPATRLAFGSGEAGPAIVRAAAGGTVDLVALAWSQRMLPGRASVIRPLLVDSPIPLLLVPIRTAGEGRPQPAAAPLTRRTA